VPEAKRPPSKYLRMTRNQITKWACVKLNTSGQCS
jgi:hypothetical protein